MLATKLINLRENKNLKSIDLAKFLNVAQSTYSGYERGKIQPSIDILIKLSKFYKVSIDWMLDNEYFDNKPDINNDQILNNIINNYKQLNNEYKVIANYKIRKLLKEQENE